MSSDAGAIVGGSWKVVDAACRIEEARQYESMFTQGNGYLSVRGSLEEGFSDDPQDRDYWRLPTNVTLEKGVDQKSVLGTFIPSVTGVHPLLNEQMANLPWFFDLRIECAGESLDVEASRLPRHCRVLDMRTGLLLRVVDWTTPAGVTVHLRYRRFVSAAEPHLSVLELHARTDGEPVTLTVRAGLDARVRTSGYNHFRSVRAWSGDTEARLQVSTDAGAQVVQRCALEGVEGLRGETHESCVELVGTLTVDGRGAAVLKRIAVANSADDDAPEETTASVLRESRRRTFRELYRSHRAVWQERWCRGDVRIEGEPAIQHAVRFSLYHLLRAVRPGDDTVGIDPKAASSAAYFGRFFWDTELYLLPFFLYTDPEAARSLVAFRCRTLDGARENARAYGYPGARYAWESAPDGTEQCPNWQYADHEIHVTADVVYGIRHYVRATGDRQFLFREALPVLVETARYWLARVDWLDGCAHLLGVMGPDEYAPFSNDNYYTNRLVKLSLDYTEATLAQLQDSDPRSYGEAVRRLRITEEERREFRQTAAALRLPRDVTRNLILQSADFEENAPIDFDAFWKDRSKPFGTFVSQERLYRSRCLKQGDVVSLLMALPGELTDEQANVAFDYYEPLTTHDSSLSPSTHALVAARLGRVDVAEEFFRRSLFIDTDAAALRSTEGVHAANCGGNWQTVVHGFAGIAPAVDAELLSIDPRMPPRITRIRTRYVWHGLPLVVDVRPGAVRVENRSGEELSVTVAGVRARLAPHGQAELAY